MPQLTFTKSTQMCAPLSSCAAGSGKIAPRVPVLPRERTNPGFYSQLNPAEISAFSAFVHFQACVFLLFACDIM